jgi:hypothetical protein
MTHSQLIRTVELETHTHTHTHTPDILAHDTLSADYNGIGRKNIHQTCWPMTHSYLIRTVELETHTHTPDMLAHDTLSANTFKILITNLEINDFLHVWPLKKLIILKTMSGNLD